MLVLARKVTQELRIGDEIIVTVLRMKRNIVSLGITAPRTVPILRPESQCKSSAETQSTGMTFIELATHVGQSTLMVGDSPE